MKQVLIPNTLPMQDIDQADDQKDKEGDTK